MGRPLFALALALAGFAAPPAPARAQDFARDGARARADVESLCAYGPRVPGTPGHERVREFLRRRLRAAGLEVREEAFSIPVPAGGAVRAVNLVARVRPELADRVVIGAHWDSRPRADQDPDPARRDEPILGANDGGSGTAVLLALADGWRTSPPAVGVDLVFFDAEDWGREGDLANYCLGAAYHARFRGPGDLPRAGVVIDMIGDADLGIAKEQESLRAARSLVENIWQSARAVGAPGFLDEVGLDVYDDHVPLLRAGIPTALLIDFDYDAWHTHADLPDRVSAESLGQVLAVLRAWVGRGAPS